MKKLIPLLTLLAANVSAQTLHNLDSSAYSDAHNKLGHCTTPIVPFREGNLSVSEAENNRVTISFPNVTISCYDPFQTIHYGPLTVNGEEAVSYRILFAEKSAMMTFETPIETTAIRYDLPIRDVNEYDIFVEAYDALGNSIFFERTESGFIPYGTNIE